MLHASPRPAVCRMSSCAWRTSSDATLPRPAITLHCARLRRRCAPRLQPGPRMPPRIAAPPPSTIQCAAAASASCRRSMGVVPAWFACPRKDKLQACLANDGFHNSERAGLVSRAQPPARCASRDNRNVPRIKQDRIARAQIPAPNREAFAPPRTTRYSTGIRAGPSSSASSPDPPHAMSSPGKDLPKRTPSSSENPITSMANESLVRRASSSTKATPQHHAKHTVKRTRIQNRVQMRSNRAAGAHPLLEARIHPAHIADRIDSVPSCPPIPSIPAAGHGR